jgi:hypothetical protein
MKPQAANTFHRTNICTNGFHTLRGDPGGGVTAGHRRGRQQDAATVVTSLAMRKGNLPEAP